MKRIVIILFAIIILALIYKQQKDELIIIPDTAIRLRIVPNSNSSFDQKMKIKVKSYLENDVYILLKNENNIDEARKKIKETIPNIKENINKIFDENNYEMKYSIDYGYNYFPEKKYRGVKYEEGYYESIIINIGKAEGDNWWCVLFPNLCLIDLEEKDNMEYKLWITEKITKYLNN